jgi:cystathionine gamma-lyase/cystathionine beta-lyase
VRAAIKPNTKMVWAETPTNPTLKVCDIAGIAKICKEKKVIFIVDNTFLTPYL